MKRQKRHAYDRNDDAYLPLKLRISLPAAKIAGDAGGFGKGAANLDPAQVHRWPHRLASPVTSLRTEAETL